MKNRDKLGKFKKGHTETPQEKLKRIEACRISWKMRPEYIGDLREKAPKLHNIWRAIRFTQKGQKIGYSQEWHNYRTFFNDVFPSYKSGLYFRRPNVLKPYSKDNFIWVSKQDMTTFQSKSIKLSYQGETLLLKDWADKLNLSLHGLRIRYFKYKDTYSIEEILFGKKRIEEQKNLKI